MRHRFGQTTAILLCPDERGFNWPLPHFQSRRRRHFRVHKFREDILLTLATRLADSIARIKNAVATVLNLIPSIKNTKATAGHECIGTETPKSKMVSEEL